MTVEVYSGTRPGRPVLALLLSAGVLIGSLGLAWLQVFEARTLGPEVRIEGTPLVVRPPKDWLRAPEDPATFVLPVARARLGKQQIERRLTFRYRHLGAFRSPAELIPTDYTPAGAAKIGPFDAKKATRRVRWELFGRQYNRDFVLLLACTPRGELITVDYAMATELTTSDLAQLDDICAALRIEDASLTVSTDDALHAAGVHFDVDAQWQVAGPQMPQVAGLHVGGSVAGVPAWAIGVFRTWLAAGRTGKDLLTDYGEVNWPAPIDEARIAEQRRSDGLTVLTARLVDLAPDSDPTAIVRLLVRSPSEAVLLTLATDPAGALAGRAALDQVSDTLEFTPADRLPPIDAAEQAGRKLIAEQDWTRVLPAWWGRQREDAYFIMYTLQGEYVHRGYHEARGRDPATGYLGRSDTFSKDTISREQWTLDPDARGYDYAISSMVSGKLAYGIEEQRDADRVTRTTAIGGRSSTREFQVGPAYVCPPVESIAEWLVAQQDHGAWIIEASTLFGRGAHSRLMRPLPPDEQGIRRVLLQEDYEPYGVLLGFDESGRWHYQREPSWRMERVSEEVARRQWKDLGLRPGFFPR